MMSSKPHYIKWRDKNETYVCTSRLLTVQNIEKRLRIRESLLVFKIKVPPPPRFPTVHFIPPSLLQKAYIISTCFRYPKEIWRWFSLLQKKRWKAKIAFSHCLSHYGGSASPEQQEWPYQTPSQELHSVSQQQAAKALNCVCEHRALSQFILCIC